MTMIRGRVLDLGNDELRWQSPQSVGMVAEWVHRDFPLANAFGFNVAVRE